MSDVRDQFFLAGTEVGFAGLAVRARVTRADVALAGEALRAAGVVFLAVTGLAPEFGASTAFSALALVLLAASSTLSSALCATEVALLDTSTTLVALSSSTSSRVSSTASTVRSARRTTRRNAGW